MVVRLRHAFVSPRLKEFKKRTWKQTPDMSAFYPGAGTDFAPPVLFPGIKTWWFMDQQPRAAHDDAPPTFLTRLDHAAERCGFRLQTVADTLRVYRSASTDQTIFYETRTCFPGAWDSTKHVGTTLVLCGYDVESSGVLPASFFPSYPNIITNSLTETTIWTAHVSPVQSVSVIQYPTSIEHWQAKNQTAEVFRDFSIKQN